MSIFSKFIKRRKTIVGLEELGRIFSGETQGWSQTSQLEQYGKSLYVFAAVNKIATKVAAIELRLYKILNSDGDSEEVLSHEILDLVTKINPFQTRTEFLKTAWINKKLTGEAFWVKIRNKKGDVVELWNLRPDKMSIVADPAAYIQHYEFTKADGSKAIFMPEDIIHFKDPNPLSTFRGMSPIAVSKYRIETEEQATKFQKNFFRNNARPDALLMTEQQLSTDQRTQMTSAWEDRHQGEGHTSKVGLLEGGMKYQQVSISQREMDYIESMKFTRDDILVAFGVPKSVITTDEVNYANADAGIRAFLSETIQPEMTQLVEVLNEFLIAPDFGEEYYLDFKDPTPSDRAALRADHTAGYGKWLTVNEIRADYNLAPVEGGDEIATPYAAFDPTQTQDPTPTDPAKSLKVDESRAKSLQRARTLKVLRGRPIIRAKFELAVQLRQDITKAIETFTAHKTNKTTTKSSSKSVVKLAAFLTTDDSKQKYYDIINKRIDKRSKKFHSALLSEFAAQEQRVIDKLLEIESVSKTLSRKMSHSDINKILDKRYENKLFATMSLPYLEEFAIAGGEDAAELIGDKFNMTERLTKAIEKRSRFFASSVNDTTFAKLTATLSQGINEGEGIAELSKRVSEVYDDIPKYRAEMIARTEATNANNEGHLDEYRESDIVQGKQWISTLDDRTRDEHAAMNGEIVDIEAVFSNGLPYPQEINCRCVLAPARFD